METILIIVVLLVLCGGGTFYSGPGPYRNGGFGIIGLLVVILVIYLLFGGLGAGHLLR